MRRTLISLAVTALAVPVMAGTIYTYNSETKGPRNVSMTAKVQAEGRNLRMDVMKGDGMLFKDGSIVYSLNGAKTLRVVDPSAKTYYDVDIEALVGGPNSMLKALGDTVKISFDNPKVATKDAGSGGIVQGFPTRKTQLDASYDMTITAMGQKMTTHIAMSTESWTTDKISADSANWFQTTAVRTGIEGLDKLIDAQSAALKGRFPLKSVSNVTTSRGGQSQTITTTAMVTNVMTKAIPASEFVIPAGYTKTESPIEKMMAMGMSKR